MRSYFRSLRFLAVVSLLFASSATVTAADTGRPIGGPRGTRVTINPKVPSRFFGAARSTAGTLWRIRDLGLPVPIEGRPSTLIATPYAINQHGDVALAVCPALRCGEVAPPETVGAYVYDYRCNRLISLAKFPEGLSPRPIDQYIPQALNERGQIVGSVVRFVGKNTVYWPVIWTRRGFDGSTIARLDSRPADQGTAFAINNLGVAVGSVFTGS